MQCEYRIEAVVVDEYGSHLCEAKLTSELIDLIFENTGFQISYLTVRETVRSISRRTGVKL